MGIIFLILAILACVYAFWDLSNWIKEQDEDERRWNAKRNARQHRVQVMSDEDNSQALIDICETIYIGRTER